MRIAVTLVVWALALIFLVAISFTVLSIFVPSLTHTHNGNTVLGGPPGSTGDLIVAAVAGVVAALLFGLLLIAIFVGALLRRQPITQSRQVRGQLEVEEARIMQEFHGNLARMDKRIESLETLLFDRPRMFEPSDPVGRGARQS